MRIITTLSAAILCAAAGAVSADQLLEDFDGGFSADRVSNKSSVTTLVDHDGTKALRIDFGDDTLYPNAVVSSPDMAWDISAFEEVEMDVTNVGDTPIQLGVRIDNKNATGRKNSSSGGGTVDPGETVTVSAKFARPLGQEIRDQLWHMAAMPISGRAGVIDPSAVVAINLFVNKPSRPTSIIVDNIRATGQFDEAAVKASLPPADKFLPFVDRFGQNLHVDWPGKVKTEEEFKASVIAEQQDLAANPAPAEWDKYGGWANGPTLDATGRFRTAKHEGKWYLVDPDGKLFFSIGVDAIRPGGGTPTDERESFFAWLPPKEGEFAEAWDIGRVARSPEGKYKRMTQHTEFHFYTANLIRKFGSEHEQKFIDSVGPRLKSWGFNTLGCWTLPAVEQTAQMPYTSWVFYWAKNLEGSKGQRKPFPDFFAPEFTEGLEKRIAIEARRRADDPFFIGFFVDNELDWGEPESIGRYTLMSPAAQPGKQDLARWLQEKHGQDIAALNKAWKSDYASWDAFLADIEVPANVDGEDLRQFSQHAARVYFSTVDGLLEKHAPGVLYLGCRFASNNKDVVAIAAEYVDVLSFNVYRETVAKYAAPVDVDLPIMITEFHFGATDRGYFGGGLREVDSQEARAKAYHNYVSGAARNPNIVGVHWFAWADEPISGRTQDAENYAIGIVTITDQPHRELIEATRDVGRHVYEIRSSANE